MGTILSLFGNKVMAILVPILVTWAITAGLNWWSDYKELQNKAEALQQAEQARDIYASAYKRSLEEQERLSDLSKLREDELHHLRGLSDKAIVNVRNIASKELSENECPTFAGSTVPHAYAEQLRAVLADARESQAGKSERSKLTPAELVRRLRGAE